MRSTKGLFVLSSAFCILLFMAAGNPEAAAQGANMMTVQGRLTDSNGAPLNGTFDICIRFWDASAAGTKLFGVKYTNVGVNNGIYTIVIGESASAADDDAVPTYTTLSALMASNPANLWMGIKVSTDSEMTPRSRVSSSLSALSLGDGTYYVVPRRLDAVTNAVTDVMKLTHASSGTPAANFGTGILLTGESDSTEGRDMARIQSIWESATDANRRSTLQFQTASTGGALATRMTVDSAGNVIINNNSVYAAKRSSDSLAIGLLKIDATDYIEIGPAWSQTPTGIKFSLNGTEQMRITSSGTVGIGTTAPIGRLNVHTTAGTSSQLWITTNTNLGSANEASIVFESDVDGTPNEAIIGQFNDGSLRFTGTGNLVNPGMALTDANYLGIGTTAPGSALDVRGTLRLSGATSGYVGFAPAAAAGSTTYVLPSADGGSGQVLTTNGAGTLSWAPAAGACEWTDTGEYLTPADGGGVRIYETGASAGYITGIVKIDCVRVDPPVQIAGEQYSTWGWDGIGLRTDVVGVGELRDGVFTLDLSAQSKGSDLWLFWKVVAENTILAFVTPQDEAYLMARMDGSVLTVKAISGVQNARFCYRLTAKRIDSADPSENMNARTMKASVYVDVDKYDKNGIRTSTAKSTADRK
jgi:hypothetical protein